LLLVHDTGSLKTGIVSVRHRPP